jgi:hypothetical protein
LLKLRLDSQSSSTTLFPLPESVQGIVQACLDSSTQVLSTLQNLLRHGIIESFFPFDLESVFSAGLIFAMIEYVHPKLLLTSGGTHHKGDHGSAGTGTGTRADGGEGQEETEWRPTVLGIMDAMISQRSLLARLRKQEMEELDSMFHLIKSQPKPLSSKRHHDILALGLTSTINPPTPDVQNTQSHLPGPLTSPTNPQHDLPTLNSLTSQADPNPDLDPDQSQISPADLSSLSSLPSLGPPFFTIHDMDSRGLSAEQILTLAEALNEEDFYGLWGEEGI